MADDSAEEPVAGGAARPVADGTGRGAEAVGPVADEDASDGPITEDARPVAGGTGKGAEAVRPVAKDSQTGQTLPVQGWIAGTTRSRMVA